MVLIIRLAVPVGVPSVAWPWW